jgi:hypothetical protein
MIRGTAYTDSAHTVLKMILPMAGSSWLHVGLGECCIWKPDCLPPIPLGCRLAVSLVEMKAQAELRILIEEHANPSYKECEDEWIGVVD